MADDEKKQMTENIRKVYHGVEFAKVEDQYDVIVQYDANAQSIALHFTNQTTKNIFKHDFDLESINKITHKVHMKPEPLANMIMDNLKSQELTAKNLRIYILADIKQGIFIFCVYVSMI